MFYQYNHLGSADYLKIEKDTEKNGEAEEIPVSKNVELKLWWLCGYLPNSSGSMELDTSRLIL